MILVDETHAVMGRADLDALAEYSLSLPSGTTAGKRWKRNASARAAGYGGAWTCDENGPWHMGEYGEPIAAPAGSVEALLGEKVVPIKWRTILVVE